MRVVSSEMAPVFLALILAYISRELPRPFQTSPSHPPSPCRLAYGLNPGPERRQQPVRTSSVRPLGSLSRGPPTWGQLTPEPPPSGKGRPPLSMDDATPPDSLAAEARDCGPGESGTGRPSAQGEGLMDDPDVTVPEPCHPK
ncbi:hypothetical protein MG293_013943 [Ovis ammon polii]|uniref:Uncharacterized protein n=1 Tax=Ovis ammon polii TaxID=230172 RepID=A0AAD4U137_OVIAM|nr:hypothetical protein MG293_013943 [Ovis ammon polii]KAI4557633.1 hypothetical protein MJT46_014312 [Ovis ammon polii x Ovis aries]